MIPNDQIKTENASILNQSGQSKEQPPLKTQNTQPRVHNTHCHVFRGTGRCTPCTESNHYLYESPNCTHRSPHKIGYFSSSFLALFSSVLLCSGSSSLPLSHLLLKRFVVIKVAFRVRDRRGALTSQSVSGEGVISRTERPTDVERPIADTLGAADRS
jgi:hypothetical protein